MSEVGVNKARKSWPFRKGVVFLVVTPIIVLGLLLAAAPCALFLALRPSEGPVDGGQFNTSRQRLPENLQATLLGLTNIGNFTLQNVWSEPSNTPQAISAFYKSPDGQNVRLWARKYDNAADKQRFLSYGIGGECAGHIRQFSAATLRYSYVYSSCMGLVQHTFNWVNGQWVISVEATHGDTLLQFVNTYPY